MSSGPPDDAGPPDHVTDNGDVIQVGKNTEEQVVEQAQTYLEKAQQAETGADVTQMSAEDRMQYFYMKTIIEVLKDDYDILLESE
jgi:hypothetical protein